MYTVLKPNLLRLFSLPFLSIRNRGLLSAAAERSPRFRMERNGRENRRKRFGFKTVYMPHTPFARQKDWKTQPVTPRRAGTRAFKLRFHCAACGITPSGAARSGP